MKISMIKKILIFSLFITCGAPALLGMENVNEVSEQMSTLTIATTELDEQLITLCLQEQENFEEFKKLIDQGANVCITNENKSNLLHIAVVKDHINIITYLVDNTKIDINGQNNYGKTPLHYCKSVEVAKILLEHEADVDIKNKKGKTAIHYVAKGNNEELLIELLKYGACITDLDIKKNTPLHIAVKYNNSIMARKLLIYDKVLKLNEYEDHAAFIENNGNLIELKNKDGFAPLHLAARYSTADMVSLLLSYDADIEAQTDSRYKILHIASESGLA